MSEKACMAISCSASASKMRLASFARPRARGESAIAAAAVAAAAAAWAAVQATATAALRGDPPWAPEAAPRGGGPKAPGEETRRLGPLAPLGGWCGELPSAPPAWRDLGRFIKACAVGLRSGTKRNMARAQRSASGNSAATVSGTTKSARTIRETSASRFGADPKGGLSAIISKSTQPKDQMSDL